MKSTRMVAPVVILAVALRVIASIYLGNQVTNLPGTADQVSYHTLALRLLDGHGFTFDKAWWPLTSAGEPTAHWSYLYTGYLVVIYSLFDRSVLAARLIQSTIVGVLQPLLAYLVAARVFGVGRSEDAPQKGSVDLTGTMDQPQDFRGRLSRFGNNLPILAALLTAVYLYFVYYSATLMTEPFFITGILLSLYLAMELVRQPSFDRRAQSLGLALGVALGVTVLLRQLFLLFVPFLLIWIGFSLFSKWSRRQIAGSLALPLGILALMILPITWFNYTQFDRFVLLNTNAGYALFWGNHPIYGNSFIPAQQMGTTYQELVPDQLRALDEAALDQALLKLGLGFILEDPGRYILLSASRIPAYFKFWPDPNSGLLSNVARVGSFGLLLPFMIFGLIRAWQQPEGRAPRTVLQFLWTPLGLLYLFIIIYSAIHILTWAQVRYRLPVDSILLLFAALAAARILSVVSKTRTLQPGH